MRADNGSENTDIRRAAERYLRAGLAVIPVPAGEKNPNRPGWQNERWTVEDVSKLWKNGQGIGILWGEPSSGLVDVDLDWPEARIAARRILPPTRTFGRPGAPESHRIIRVTGRAPKTKRYKTGGDGDDRSVVEVLSTGTQSLIPPSLHASGERREWHGDRTAAEMDGVALAEGVADIATAALIARNWPGKGARKDYSFAATGYIGRRLPRWRAERVMEAAIDASGDEETHSRLRDMRDTLDDLEAGRPTTGGPTLDSFKPGLVDQLRHWHGWRSGGDSGYTIRPEQGPPSFRLTDLGNAERLIARHGDDLRYCHPWSKWLVWDGKRWAVDASGEVERRASETVTAMYHEADPGGGSIDKALATHAIRSEARSRIEAMIALGRSRPSTPVQPEQLDADPWLLNVENGTVDLRSGELREHRREDLITKLVPVEYDPSAEAPIFDGFLTRILPSQALRGFLQRAFGYAATGVAREEILLVAHGGGDNGKTTLAKAVMEALGGYSMSAAPDLLLAKRGAHPTELADLFGARLVAAVESEEGRRLNESLVKQLTGRDPIKARRMREDFWEFEPTHTIFFATNHKPEIRGTDHAIWRRIKLIPFEVKIPEHDKDKELPEKLRTELSGILAWIVRGCLEWQRTGLGEPDEVAAATGQYREEMDALAGFIEDRCVVRPDAWARFSDLYASYKEWCEESNERPEKKRRFADSLTERGFARDTGAKNTKIRRGIALRHDGNPDPVQGYRS